ncbi:type II secretion system protein GspG [Bremerella sp.]|uniref:type II secretion system protein GspG n=1 Tax=Bremerella sp. TaxID=2795602 RepID=UPI00391DF6F0
MTAIGESFYRIHLYANANQKLPPTLDDLPRREGYGNRITDGWGNRLNYEISDAGVVTLSSLGADQKPGGTGDDADISRSYRSIDEQGTFIAGEHMWIVTGELHSEVGAE